MDPAAAASLSMMSLDRANPRFEGLVPFRLAADGRVVELTVRVLVGGVGAGAGGAPSLVAVRGASPASALATNARAAAYRSSSLASSRAGELQRHWTRQRRWSY